jgi:hypothetical protein
MRALVALALTAVLVGCGDGSAPPVDEALARDLELVGTTSSFELTPSAGETQVMSALEQGETAPTVAPAPSPERRPVGRSATQPRSPRTRAPSPAPQAVAEAPAPSPEVVVERPAPAPAPVASAPASQSAPLGAGPAPPGGWKSVGEVIRNSRVPITP